MNDLRWILIACGAALLVGIYLWGRRGDKRATSGPASAERVRAEPPVEPVFAESFHDEPEELGVDRLGPEFDADEPQLRETLPARAAVTSRTDTVIRESRPARLEPTLGNDDSPEDVTPLREVDPGVTAELPVREPVAAPTLGMSSTPAPRRIERRKIIALRLAAPAKRFPGDALREALESESLEFGRYDVFHRMSDGGSVFSVASMMEPGTFQIDAMAGQQYAGVTMFAQLPGPLPGVHALQDLVACGKRLQEVLGGTLQDERGVPLTVHRIDRLRQEIVDFERAQARDQRSPTSTH